MSPLTHRFSRSTWYLLGVIYTSMFAMVLASVMWSSHVSQESDRRWCGVLSVYHDAYARNPGPTSQVGRDIQRQLEQLYTEFRCAEVGDP